MLVIPVFIPHQGCPRNCLFCNQHTISGQKETTVDDTMLVNSTIFEWLARSRSPGNGVQVAFYGGSFTCLERKRQEILLDAVAPFIARGVVDSVRLSTRPDCMDGETASFLAEKKVKTVELGVQSMDDTVLRASWRGHSAADSVKAAGYLRAAGLETGIQLMPGLPGESTGSWLATVRDVVALAPAFVRLYPTLVVAGAGLVKSYHNGTYRPMSMNLAIARCRRAREIFDGAGIRIMRMGLQASENLESQILAGPYHPAFGELVISRQWFKMIRKILFTAPKNSMIKIGISERDLSSVVGIKRCNMKRIAFLMEKDSENRTFTLDVKNNYPRGTLKYVIAKQP